MVVQAKEVKEGGKDRPLLLLDIDGVLCPFGGDLLPGFQQADLVWYSSRNGQWVKELMQDFNIVWASYWEKDANEIIAPLHDLDPFPYIEFTSWPKLGAVKAYVGDTPLAWVDDDLDKPDFTWARKRPSPTLLIQADPNIGLTLEHCDELKKFARSISQ